MADGGGGRVGQGVLGDRQAEPEVIGLDLAARLGGGALNAHPACPRPEPVVTRTSPATQ